MDFGFFVNERVFVRILFRSVFANLKGCFVAFGIIFAVSDPRGSKGLAHVFMMFLISRIKTGKWFLTAFQTIASSTMS